MAEYFIIYHFIGHQNSDRALQRIPPQVFGENVLRNLDLKELCVLDTAVSDKQLREHWWVGQGVGTKNSSWRKQQFLDVCLRHAVHPDTEITVSSDKQMVRMLKRWVISTSHVIVDTMSPVATSVELLLESPKSFRLSLRSLLIRKYKGGWYTDLISKRSNLISFTIIGDYNFITIGTIIRNIPELASLTLLNTMLAGLANYLKEAKALKHLHLSHFHYLGTSSLADYLPQRSQLESISWINCNEDEFGPIAKAFFAHHEHCPLRHLNLTQESCDVHLIIDDALLTSIASACPLLETLDIGLTDRFFSQTGAGQVTDAAIVFLAQQCSGLRKVILRHQVNLTYNAFDALVTKPGTRLDRNARHVSRR